MWLCWCGSFILRDLPAKFGGHRPHGSEDNGVYKTISNSNSNSEFNSNAGFTNGTNINYYQRDICLKALISQTRIMWENHCHGNQK